MKKSKIILCFLLLLMLVSILNITYAIDESAAIAAMQGMSEDTTPGGADKLGGVINAGIKVIQVAGTGISLIMVTVLGIRYLMAAPSEKGDVKKQIVPMVIGAVILFASVNLVQIIANFTEATF